MMDDKHSTPLGQGRQDEPQVRETEDTRQAVTGQGVRYVLAYGLLAVVIGFMLVGAAFVFVR